nr:unnamed protein product [Callosobruchus chinensis]
MAAVLSTPETQTSMPTKETKASQDPSDMVEFPQTSSTVWIAAIALFFNRWGKIRMLLPYQPDYKQEQLKVPGTAACAAAVAQGGPCTHGSRDHICQQVLDGDQGQSYVDYGVTVFNI